MIFKTWVYKILIRTSSIFIGNFLWRKESAKYSVALGKRFDDINIKKAIDLFNDHFKMEQDNHILKLKNISKTYDNGYVAVQDFNLTINPKEFVCLLGPSGCGKTTLLRMVAGLETITRGEYFMNGVSLNASDPSERNTSMVFQNYALYPFMTVYKNVSFGLKLKNYNNPIFNNFLEKYLLLNKSNYINIKALRRHIHELKYPLKGEINNLKINIKKAKKRKNIKKINEYKIKLKIIILKNNKLIEENKNLILKTLEEIKKLKKENKEKRVTNKKIFNENKKEFKIKKHDFNLDSKNYYAKNKNKLFDKKLEIKNKKNEINKILEDQRKFMKSVILDMKKLDGKENSLVNYSKHNKKIKSFENQINIINNDIQEKKFEISIIKDKNFIIKNEEKRKILNVISFKELIKMAIIWKKTIPFRIVQLSKIVGLDNFLNRKPSELSGGQRQRVALMRAISKESKLFLFDEPLSNLDAKLRSKMRTEIRKIHDSTKSTSLYVTHDQIEAMTMADKVVVMNNGYVQQIDTPKNLYKNPSNIFVAKFIGVPTMNILNANYEKGKTFANNGFEIKDIPRELNNKIIHSDKFKKILIGIRPNMITISSKNKNSFKAKVLSIELTGSEVVISVQTENLGTLRVLTKEINKFNIHDEIYINLNWNNIHIFDEKTGYCLTSMNNIETLNARKIWEDNITERYINRKIINKEKNKKTLSQKAINSVKNNLNNQNKIDNYKKQIETFNNENSKESL